MSHNVKCTGKCSFTGIFQCITVLTASLFYLAVVVALFHLNHMSFHMQELVPEIHMHFQAQSFHTSMYASSWFLTLFTSCLPHTLACRVMDLFLSEVGHLFSLAIYFVAICYLRLCKAAQLQLTLALWQLLFYFVQLMGSFKQWHRENLLVYVCRDCISRNACLY